MLPRSNPTLRHRILVSLGVAVAAALIARYAVQRSGNPGNASDFTWYWRAGRAVLAGQSPYAVINATGPYPHSEGFLYPLPAAHFAAPFALLPLWDAMALWVGALAGFLSFAMTRDGFWRLPLLMSLPMLWCAQSGQWTPLVLGAAFLPIFGGLAVGKPTLAAAAFAYTPRMRFLLSVTAVIIASLLVAPAWPSEYLAEIRARTSANYHVPVLVMPGPALLLAALRWRRPEARLLFVMSCVPQTMLFYDQLPLTTVASSFRQALVMALASYAPIVAIFFLPRPVDDTLAATAAITSGVIVWLYYLPCLVMVLRRPNEGRVPPVLERLSTRLPGWLRGQPGP